MGIEIGVYECQRYKIALAAVYKMLFSDYAAWASKIVKLKLRSSLLQGLIFIAGYEHCGRDCSGILFSGGGSAPEKDRAESPTRRVPPKSFFLPLW